MDILDARKDLHSLIDPLWQSGRYSRDEVYQLMSNHIGREAHISEMDIKEIKDVASYIVDLNKEYYPCYKCKYNICMRFNIPVCMKKVKRESDRCGRFETKTNI